MLILKRHKNARLHGTWSTFGREKSLDSYCFNLNPASSGQSTPLQQINYSWHCGFHWQYLSHTLSQQKSCFYHLSEATACSFQSSLSNGDGGPPERTRIRGEEQVYTLRTRGGGDGGSPCADPGPGAWEVSDSVPPREVLNTRHLVQSEFRRSNE